MYPKRIEYRGHFLVKWQQTGHWYVDDKYDYDTLRSAKRRIDRIISDAKLARAGREPARDFTRSKHWLKKSFLKIWVNK